MSNPGDTRMTHAALRRRFRSHLARNAGIAVAVLVVSLAIGMAGYHWLAPMPWLDAFVNAAMLLGGMGPVKTDLSPAGKVFAGAYALYSGLVFVVATGVVLAPVLHRLLHHFHLDEREKG